MEEVEHEDSQSDSDKDTMDTDEAPSERWEARSEGVFRFLVIFGWFTDSKIWFLARSHTASAAASVDEDDDNRTVRLNVQGEPEADDTRPAAHGFSSRDISNWLPNVQAQSKGKMRAGSPTPSNASDATNTTSSSAVSSVREGNGQVLGSYLGGRVAMEDKQYRREWVPLYDFIGERMI